MSKFLHRLWLGLSKEDYETKLNVDKVVREINTKLFFDSLKDIKDIKKLNDKIMAFKCDRTHDAELFQSNVLSKIKEWENLPQNEKRIIVASVVKLTGDILKCHV
jgi:hypothetical protein